MNKIKFRKEQISIQNIGRQRFWIGIIAGAFSAVSISLFFNYSREILRYLTSLSTDLLILKEKELLFFNAFFSLLSALLGQSIAVWIWMNHNNHKRSKDWIYKQISRTNALLVFWVLLMVVSRFGTILTILLFGSEGYDNHLNLFEEFWIIFILIPIVAFMQIWFSVRLIYRAGKWIFISSLVCLFTSFFLQLTTSVNQEIVNQADFKKFEKDYNFLEQEIKKAETKYGIRFKPNTIDILKKWHTDSAIQQVAFVKKSFAQDKPVSMEVIILQKIIIRNFKHGRWDNLNRNSLKNWHYAYPIDVLKQLKYCDKNAYEVKELIDVLNEMIKLVNTESIDGNAYYRHTDSERRRSIAARNNIPDTLINQLKEVRTTLLNDTLYSKFINALPHINKRD
jgi:hypothetical protein